MSRRHWRYRFGLLTAAILFQIGIQSWGSRPLARQADPIAALEQAFQNPPNDSRIMMRWWWFGPSITRDEIDAEMQRMKEGGIGGFEVSVVYPMSVDDPARGIRNYAYLSPEFLERFAFAARRARELGLRMDVTLGSGWSFGGPHITPELASARLRSDRREITPDVLHIERPAPYEHEQLIAAFIGRGAIREVDANSFQLLDLSGTGPIRLPRGEGPRSLLFYFSSRTGQVVKRAAIGAEGYVLDHYSRAAIDTHLREVGDKLIAAAGPGGLHAIFCDSLEVYEASWTPAMLVEFQKRRGYDLRPQLPMIEYGNDARAQQVRRDVGRTLTELYEERFLAPIREWSQKNKVLFRIQGYGQPPAALSSYRYADLLDGEGFEWRMLSRARWAASAAHVLGRNVAASETWTWVHSPAFRATPLDLKGEADLHFLSGINQLIGHGWPHSSAKAPAPGWPFYAAGALTDKNPWWPVMPDLAGYLHRVSFLLRQGEPVSDVAVYAPTEDARASMRPGANDYLNLWAGVRDRLGPALVPAILDAGYSFDLIDDGTLQEAAARNYKAIVLPSVRWMPDSTKSWLDAYSRAGGTVIALGRVPEGEWPALRPTPVAELTPRLASAVPPDMQVTPASPEIGFVHRRVPGADVYFVANTHNAPRNVAVRFRSQTAYAESWNPFDGRVERLPAGGEGISLHMEAYGSRIVVFRATPGAAPLRQTRSQVSSDDLRSGWTVTLGSSRASEDVELPHSWANNSATRFFSGTATYRRRLDVPASSRGAGSRVILDFGAGNSSEREALPDGTMRGNSFAALVSPPIREAATVLVNQRRVGAVWAPPYRLDITDYLRDGSNDLVIEVYNTAINQLAEQGRLPDVNGVTERYGQRFRLQDMDIIEPLPSGIAAVPRLVVER